MTGRVWFVLLSANTSARLLLNLQVTAQALKVKTLLKFLIQCIEQTQVLESCVPVTRLTLAIHGFFVFMLLRSVTYC